MLFIKHAFFILRRDLKIEYRQKSLLLSMIVFAILINVIFQIAFDTNSTAMQSIGPGILWLPILLAALLGFTKYGSYERENRGDIGILVSPIDPGSLFLGKLLGNFLIVLLVCLASVPSFFLFIKHPFPQSIGLLLLTIFLGSWGFTAIGVFLATLTQASRISELLLPIMIFPLSVPLLIAVIQLTSFSLYPSALTGMELWIYLLVGYNLIFTIVPILLFELLLEV